MYINVVNPIVITKLVSMNSIKFNHQMGILMDIDKQIIIIVHVVNSKPLTIPISPELSWFLSHPPVGALLLGYILTVCKVN